MQRVVIDTNIYVDWLNSGQYEAVLFQPGTVKHLSSVVMMELWAGAFSPRDRKLLRNITTGFAKVSCILLPTCRGCRFSAWGMRRLCQSQLYSSSYPNEPPLPSEWVRTARVASGVTRGGGTPCAFPVGGCLPPSQGRPKQPVGDGPDPGGQRRHLSPPVHCQGRALCVFCQPGN
jgi:hypothetical protein